MSTFSQDHLPQPGELVLCVNAADSAGLLTQGATYVVDHIGDGPACVALQGVRYEGWYPHRFAPVKAEPAPVKAEPAPVKAEPATEDLTAVLVGLARTIIESAQGRVFGAVVRTRSGAVRTFNCKVASRTPEQAAADLAARQVVVYDVNKALAAARDNWQPAGLDLPVGALVRRTDDAHCPGVPLGAYGTVVGTRTEGHNPAECDYTVDFPEDPYRVVGGELKPWPMYARELLARKVEPAYSTIALEGLVSLRVNGRTYRFAADAG